MDFNYGANFANYAAPTQYGYTAPNTWPYNAYGNNPYYSTPYYPSYTAQNTPLGATSLPNTNGLPPELGAILSSAGTTPPTEEPTDAKLTPASKAPKAFRLTTRNYLALSTAILGLIGVSIFGTFLYLKNRGEALSWMTGKHSKEVSHISHQVSGFISSAQPEVAATLKQLKKTLKKLGKTADKSQRFDIDGVNAVIKSTQAQVDAIGRSVTDATGEVRTLVNEARPILTSTQSQIDTIGQSANEAVREAKDVITSVRPAVDRAKGHWLWGRFFK